jgi:hypothetical protein
LEEAVRFLASVRGLYTLIELHDRRHRARHLSAPGSPDTDGSCTALVEARRIWQRLVDKEDLRREPLKLTHPNTYNDLRSYATALANAVQGEQVTVNWPLADGAGARAVPFFDIDIDREIAEVSRLERSDDTAWYIGSALAEMLDALTRAATAVSRSPRERLGFEIVREATDDNGSGPLHTCLERVKSIASVADQSVSAAVDLMQVRVESTFIHMAGDLPGRAREMRGVLDRMGYYLDLSDAERRQLGTILDRVEREGGRTREVLTDSDVEAIRGVVRPNTAGTAYGGALAILSWIGLALALKDPPADATRLERVEHWGAIASEAAAATDATFQFMTAASERILGLRAVAGEAAVMGAISNGASVIGGVATMLEGAVEVEQGFDEYNDVEVTLGGATMFSGAMMIVAAAFPGTAPVALVVAAGVGGAHMLWDYYQQSQPYNLRFAKALCNAAVDIEPRGEDQGIAERLGVKDALLRLAGTRARGPAALIPIVAMAHALQDDGESSGSLDQESGDFWRPLCLDAAGNIDRRATGHRAQGTSWAGECTRKLQRALGRLPGMDAQVRALLYSGHGLSHEASSYEDRQYVPPIFQQPSE